MLSIREFSDLHLEHYYDTYYQPDNMAQQELSQLIPHLDTDPDTVLIIAGDLAPAIRVNRIITFLELIVPRFKHVIYVFGNHEHYGGIFEQTHDIVMNAISKSSVIDASKLTVAGNEVVRTDIDGVTFLTGTMWTDYGNMDPDTVANIARWINDHRAIMTSNSRSMTPRDAFNVHKKTIAEFASHLDGADNSRTVIVTHHMPSFDAVDPKYMNDKESRMLNAAFATNLNEFILTHSPAYWFFGHTHSAFNSKIGNTRLICNPLGYPFENNFNARRYDTANMYSI